MFNNKFMDLIDNAATTQGHQFNMLLGRLDTIIELLTVQVSDQQVIIQKENTIMATMQNVTDAIAAESSVDDSIITLLNGIVQQLKDAQAAGDPAALDAVVAGIQANTLKIQTAVTANTPVTPVQAAATA